MLFLSQTLVSSHHSPMVNIGCAKQDERKTEKQEAIRKKGKPTIGLPSRNAKICNQNDCNLHIIFMSCLFLDQLSIRSLSSLILQMQHNVVGAALNCYVATVLDEIAERAT